MISPFLIVCAPSKYRTGFDAYLANTGTEHPLAKGFHLIRPHSFEFNNTRRATGSDPLSDESNGLFWKGSITVGDPAQTFTVDFDTGSSDLFLPGPNCDSSCSGHTIYDPSTSSASSDQHKTYTLRYGDGSSVTGEEYTDTMSIAGITVCVFRLYGRTNIVDISGLGYQPGRRGVRHLFQGLL